MDNWTELIDDLVAGRWMNPETQELASVPFESIVIKESLEGQEVELLSQIGLSKNLLLVCDETTYKVLGKRIENAFSASGEMQVMILDHPHADLSFVEELRPKLSSFDGVVACGSGTVNDICKHSTMLNGQRYAVFATSGSMNGYTSATASMRLDSGLKISLPSHAPAGFFADLSVSASAPPYLAASGFGDCLCRSVAQVDWWLSHRLLGTLYLRSPYIIQEQDEPELNSRAGQLPKGDIEAMGYLHRVLTLGGLGVSFSGVSNAGSMGEHQISHYIDCFAGDRHPGTLHGQQVGVASLTMARLQSKLLSSDKPPTLKSTVIDLTDMERRMGKGIAKQCRDEFAKKSFEGTSLEQANHRLQEIWTELKDEVQPFLISVEEMEELLKSSGGPVNYRELGVEADLYRDAIVHCREMRNRFSFLDIAADAGILEDFAAEEMNCA
ncbi:MAG: iron-containing alcohol dehydrogenase [Deltaproteobacteria bacterium]|jgi:glycerol-1-phosphate dehydrogenase [NAD(P)+]